MNRPSLGSFAVLKFWSGFSSCIAPILKYYLHYRCKIGKEDPIRLKERMGFATLPRPVGKLICFHAASVGEVVSIFPVINAVQRLNPQQEILLTTGTLTSAQIVYNWLKEESKRSSKIRHQFIPLDSMGWVRRFLDYWHPDVIVLVESELWPNLILQSYKNGIVLALINARLSDKTVKAWRHFPKLAHDILSCFQQVFARSEKDRQNFLQFEIKAECHGDLKQIAPELPVDLSALEHLRQVIQNRPIWLAASTHAEEEAVIVNVHKKLTQEWPNLWTIIVPRHPQRGDKIIKQLGFMPRRSLNQYPDHSGLWLCDTLGELGLFYRLADIVFMGNSLNVTSKGGGHNPFEPARLHCALATGLRIENFVDAYQVLSNAVTITPTEEALTNWVHEMLRFPKIREQKAKVAFEMATQNNHLPDRIAQYLLSVKV